jgi:hypothetical protein
VKSRLRAVFVSALALVAGTGFAARALAQTDPLPSWNEGPVKQAIIEFVQATTDESRPTFVPPAQRIATFDNDGTLWPSHPMYTQLAFALDRIKTPAPQHPEWKDNQPFKAVPDDDHWGLGPSFVILHIEKGSPWVYGALANNIWSVGGGDDPSYNNFLLQPFINYNLPKGLYLTSSPAITANWKADSNDRWTVPLGGGVGKIFRIGKQAMNAQAQAFYNVVTPDDGGADRTLRLRLQFLFPE